MNRLALILCLLGVAISEEQLKLEDIERDNLASERRGEEPKPAAKEPNPYVTPPKPVTPLELQYGFRPMKIEPQTIYSNGQPQYFPVQDQLGDAPQQQYPVPQYYLSYPTLPSPASKQAQFVARQQQFPQQQYQLQSPYLTQNHIPQEDQAYQRYYVPQYVYLQQLPAATSNIHAIVDPKGGIQYVMYVPEHVLHENREHQSEPIDTVFNSQQQQFSQQQYITPDLSDKGQQYQFIQPQVQPESLNYNDIQYSTQPELPKSPRYEFGQQKFEPKSLLDSYVPSILQVQYYKQHQAQQSASGQSPTKLSHYKLPENPEFVNNYAQQEQDTQTQNLQYLKPPHKA